MTVKRTPRLLLGLSFNAYGRKLQLKFDRFQGEKYQLQFLNVETKFRTGIDRPIKIIEKKVKMPKC